MNGAILTHEEIQAYIKQMKEASELIANQRRQLTAAHACLQEIANEDYRGNRSSASTKAFFFLEGLKKRKAYES